MTQIQHTAEFQTPMGPRVLTLVAETDMVHGVCEVDLVEVHDENGEMYEMGDYETMTDEYEEENGPDSAADAGIKFWRELQDVVAFEGV